VALDQEGGPVQTWGPPYLDAIPDACPVEKWLLGATARGGVGTVEQRVACLRALGAGADSSIATEVVVFLNDVEKRVQVAAAGALANLARRAFPNELEPGVVYELLEVLDRGASRSVEAAVCEALGCAGSRSTVSDLLQRIAGASAFLRDRLVVAVAAIELLDWRRRHDHR